MPNLHTSRFRLTEDGRLEVYDARLATRLNRVLRRYDAGTYAFKRGEEAVFQVPSDQLESILRRFLAPKSAQPGDPLCP
jgi:hypothetical protein